MPVTYKKVWMGTMWSRHTQRGSYIQIAVPSITGGLFIVRGARKRLDLHIEFTDTVCISWLGVHKLNGIYATVFDLELSD